jgi:error-prone DNA polymerase
VTFLREELRLRGIVPCADLLTSRDGQRVAVAGLVLVRQRPGTATGVIFITLEDETGIANLVIWSSVFERQRRIVLSASMLGCRGRVQRKGDVIHLVAEQLEDLSDGLRSVGNRQQPCPVPHGCGDGVPHQNGPDPRAAGDGLSGNQNASAAIGRHKGIRVPTRSFR